MCTGDETFTFTFIPLKKNSKKKGTVFKSTVVKPYRRGLDSCDIYNEYRLQFQNKGTPSMNIELFLDLTRCFSSICPRDSR